jgi:hypothetical protein
LFKILSIGHNFYNKLLLFKKQIMKSLFVFFLLTASYCWNRETKCVYIGSTPANDITRSFLSIPLSDSVDFIKWHLVINSNHYHLKCIYGIAKPGTAGFINGGKEIDLFGDIKSEVNRYTLHNQDKKISFFKLNDNLLHLLNPDKTLAAGTSGWSYTLSAEKPLIGAAGNVNKDEFILNDSMIFYGRSPCRELENIRGLQLAGDCQRLKWLVTLYADSKTKQPTMFLMRGTAFEGRAAKTGKWSIINTNNGGQLYKLDLGKSEGSVYFLRPDENVLTFASANGALLVGNDVFSYTLNKKSL